MPTGMAGSIGQHLLAKHDFGAGSMKSGFGCHLTLLTGKSLEIVQTGTTHLRVGKDSFKW
jgi:hypothetical protein